MKRILFLILGIAFLAPSTFAATKLTIGAAISMKEAMEQLAAAYALDNPANRVSLTFGSTANIVRQIQSGAPIDVFISADLNNIEVLTKSEHLLKNSASRLAGNEVLLVTTTDNGNADAKVFFEDKTGGRIAICDPSVPIGRYADMILKSMDVAKKIKTRTVIVENVRAAMTMVLNRATQAAFIYRTDYLLHSKQLRILPFPSTIKSSAEYFAAATVYGEKSQKSAGFLLFLKSEAAKKILSKNGFQP